MNLKLLCAAIYRIHGYHPIPLVAVYYRNPAKSGVFLTEYEAKRP